MPLDADSLAQSIARLESSIAAAHQYVDDVVVRTLARCAVLMLMPCSAGASAMTLSALRIADTDVTEGGSGQILVAYCDPCSLLMASQWPRLASQWPRLLAARSDLSPACCRRGGERATATSGGTWQTPWTRCRSSARRSWRSCATRTHRRVPVAASSIHSSTLAKLCAAVLIGCDSGARPEMPRCQLMWLQIGSPGREVPSEGVPTVDEVHKGFLVHFIVCR